jgi:bZIP transcription factor
MLTMVTAGAAMPTLDLSAALEAAVAAAAEIARVGLTDDLSIAFAAPTRPFGMTGVLPSAQQRGSPSVATQHQQVLVTPAPLLQHTQKLQQLSRPMASYGSSSTLSDQSTGQKAAGDHEVHHHNDLSSGAASVCSMNDAAGEKTGEETEEDAAKRLSRSRERNREHARRTRLRKKAQLEALQSKVRDLEAEKKALKLKVEECSIASILIHLAEPTPEEQQQDETTSLLDATMQRQEKQQLSDARISLLTAGKRKRFASVDTSEENKLPQTLKLQIDGQTTLIGPKSHINWKSGVYSDDNGAQRQLTLEQLEGLR